MAKKLEAGKFFLTKQGKELLAKTYKTPLELTYISIGDGKVKEDFLSEEISSPLHEILREKIQKYTKRENRLLLETSFNNESLEVGFYVREISVFANDIDGKEILFSYLNYCDMEVDYFRQGDGNTVLQEIFEITIDFDDAKEVTILVSPGLAFVTKEELLDLKDNIGNRLDMKADRSILHECTMLSSMWNGTEAPFLYCIEKGGITENNIIEIVPRPPLTKEQTEAMTEAEILTGTQKAGIITLEAYGEKPEQDIPITMIIRGDL